MATLSPITPARRYERGGVSWVTLLILASMAGSIYLLVVWAPIYVVHYEVRQAVREYMNQAVKDPDDAKLVENLCAKLKSLHSTAVVRPDGKTEQVPSVLVRPEDVTWERDLAGTPPTLRVTFEYTREVRYPFLSDEPREWVGSVDLTNDLTMPDWGPSR